MIDAPIPERHKWLYDKIIESSPSMNWKWGLPLIEEIAEREELIRTFVAASEDRIKYGYPWAELCRMAKELLK